jgi:hypothetical protein
MFGWTLLDAMLGGDAETLLGEADFAIVPEDEENEELETDLAPPGTA